MDNENRYSKEVFRRNMHTLRKNIKYNGFNRIKNWFLNGNIWKNIALVFVVAFFIISGIIAIWIASLKIPDMQSFQDKILAGSTKIYDKTGQIMLFDLNQNSKRTVVPFDQISQHIKDATLSIEDPNFYTHKGVELKAIARALITDVFTLHFSQGGSTITQQVVKNSLLTNDKKISRKIKEWVLALKLERVLDKNSILNLYLNSSPYGGNIYGVEEASETYFGIPAANLDVAQSAYIAAIPQAPGIYSPFGTHTDRLEARKNLVLSKMKNYGYISEAEYTSALAEKVVFTPPQTQGIKAPHFVMFIRDYLEQKYGDDMIKNGNLKVITTLDYSMQQKAEAIVKQYALSNEKKYNAKNAAMVAIDPTTGQILTMVGSRDYFDKEIGGNFNVALAHRQPGSAFKPFAYVTAFNKGYTPDTVLFDVPTQFSTACDPSGNPLSPGANCYSPQNYDHKFLGPISLRNALAQSRNIPSIKLLYLAGLQDTLQTAKDLGITTLTNTNQYGLTLVLGGGEVSPLEMTNAYSVFANNGIKNTYTGILKITDKDGNVLEQFTPNPTQELQEQPVLLLNDILHDNNARMPLNGPNSATDFPDREVALKTGTTNNSRDAWIIGYTPQIAVGAWAGNNDDTPMFKKTSGLIVAPMWRAFMDQILPDYPQVSFKRPDPIDPSLKPILRGIWQGGQTYFIDKSSGLLATDQTPPDMKQEVAVPDVHSILYWIDRSDPKGPPPSNPAQDPQFNLWEPSVIAWAAQHSSQFSSSSIPTQYDNVHATGTIQASITNPAPDTTFNKTDKIIVNITANSKFPISKAEFYINGIFVGNSTQSPFSFSFVPQDINGIIDNNELKVTVYDSVENKTDSIIHFRVNK